jgi:hypothetical protein
VRGYGPGAPLRLYGPAVGEPSVLADPRRWGSLLGLAGGMTFVGSYSPALGLWATAAAWTAGLAGVVLAVVAHYVRPVGLGVLPSPRRYAVPVYCGCVVTELLLIAIGLRILASIDQSELRPALVAVAVGVHLLPLGWAFEQRMFLGLGSAVIVIGCAGLAAGAAGVPRAAAAAAVACGLVMVGVIALYAQGRFAEAEPSGRG